MDYGIWKFNWIRRTKVQTDAASIWCNSMSLIPLVCSETEIKCKNETPLYFSKFQGILFYAPNANIFFKDKTVFDIDNLFTNFWYRQSIYQFFISIYSTKQSPKVSFKTLKS